MGVVPARAYWAKFGSVSRAQRSTSHKRVYARLRRAMAKWYAADTDLGFTRDRHLNARKSGMPDLRGPSQSVAVPDQRCTASRCTASGTRGLVRHIKWIIPMLRWLAQFLTVPIVNGFLDAYKAKLAAANAQGAQAAELARAALLAEIEARRSADAVIIAEQGRWYTAIIRPLLAAPVVIYLWKVIVWDIVLGLGTTDAIGGDVAAWAGSIVTAYVGGRSLEKIARTIWRRP